MAAVLQRTLRKLCCNTGWTYAIFWKLKRRSRMVLTWEDGYCKHKESSSTTNTEMASSSLRAGNCLKTIENTLEQRGYGQEGAYLEEQISLALATLSYQVYSLGEGIIGRVAFTGKHQWFYNDGNQNGSCGSNFRNRSNHPHILEKYPDGWQNQLAAGIKTIAVVAVLQGVVQLGSMEMIKEDLNWIDEIKSVFSSLQGASAPSCSDPSSEERGQHPQSAAPLNAGKDPLAPIGLFAPVLQDRSGQRITKYDQGNVFHELEHDLMSKIGSCKGSTDPQTLPALSKLFNPLKYSGLNSRQDFLQSTLYNNVEAAVMSSPSAIVSSADLKLSHPLSDIDIFHTNVSLLGNEQMLSSSKGMPSSNLKIIDERLLQSSCLAKDDIPSSKITRNLLSRGHIGGLGKSVQVGTPAWQKADDFRNRNQISCRFRSIPEVPELNTIILKIDTPTGYDYNSGLLQDQPLGGGLGNTEPSIKNLSSEPCQSQPITNSSNRNSILQVGQPVASLYNLATCINSSCREGVLASFELPARQVPFCLHEKILDQRGWINFLNEDPAKSTSQTTEILDHDGILLENEPFGEGLQTNQSLLHNVRSEFYNKLLLTDATPENSTLQLEQPLTSLYNLPTVLNISRLEGTMVRVESPINQDPLYSDNTILDWRCLDKVLSKAPTIGAFQNPAELLGQYTETRLGSRTFSNSNSSSGYNIIDAEVGYFRDNTGNLVNDLKSYVTSFTKSGEKNSSFEAGDELSEALGPAFKKVYNNEFKEILNTTLKEMEGDYDPSIVEVPSATALAESEMAQSLGSSCSKHELCKMTVSTVYSMESKLDPLLEAVVGACSMNHTTPQNFENSYPCKSTFSGYNGGRPSVFDAAKAGEETEKICNASTTLNSTNEVDTMESIFNSHTKQILPCHMQKDSQLETVRGRNLALEESITDISAKTILGPLVDEGQNMKSENAQLSQGKNANELTKASRKRARPGESTRPRPKDRQQIQDRVRELREIVPNGSKCSIDALLEKTIKHMRFLQSVTQHAHKLKQSGELKVSRNGESLNNISSAASWAIELGGQRMECPIIVENLNQPRQLRIEMLCEEHGLFLEIADMIRGLGLTILLGIMESQIDKIWARFVVEANRDIHRIDVLWSLMQLLQPSTKNVSSVTCQTVSNKPSSNSNSEHFVNANIHHHGPLTFEGNAALSN